MLLVGRQAVMSVGDAGAGLCAAASGPPQSDAASWSMVSITNCGVSESMWLPISATRRSRRRRQLRYRLSLVSPQKYATASADRSAHAGQVGSEPEQIDLREQTSRPGVPRRRL